MSGSFVKPGVAERILGVKRRTIQKWAEAGKINVMQPGGDKGQRLYDLASLSPELATSIAPDKHPSDTKKRDDYIYARVDSSKLGVTLEKHLDILHGKHQSAKLVSDVASGFDFYRDGRGGGRGGGLNKLLELVKGGKVATVFVADPVHLGHFSFGLFEHMFELHGTKIVVDPVVPTRFNEADEFENDILAVIRKRRRLKEDRKRKREVAATAAAAKAAAAASSSNTVQEPEEPWNGVF